MLPGSSTIASVMPTKPRANFRGADCAFARAVSASTRRSATMIGDRRIRPPLELREHRIGAAHVQSRPGLDVELLDLSVLHDHPVALRALPHAEAARIELESDRACEL